MCGRIAEVSRLPVVGLSTRALVMARSTLGGKKS